MGQYPGNGECVWGGGRNSECGECEGGGVSVLCLHILVLLLFTGTDFNRF